MKQLLENNKKACVIGVIIALIVIAGIIVTMVLGFNKEMQYEPSQSIDIYIEQKPDLDKIRDICNEVLQQKNTIQTVEIYEDMVTITAKTISEEQKNNIVNKVKENYEFKQTAEETEIKNLPATRIRDMYKKYVLPFVISGIVVLIYMAIRYYKKGIVKVLVTTFLIPVIAQVVLFSIYAITRIPLGRTTPIIAIVVYILSILYVTKRMESK